MTFRIFPEPQPTPDTSAGDILVSVPASVAAYVSSILENVKYRPLWQDDAAYAVGVQQITQMQIGLMSDMSSEIVNAINRLYALQAQALNGTVHEAALGDGEIVYSPPLPAGAPVLQDGIGVAPGLRRQMLDAQGTVPAGFFGLFPRPATWADLLYSSRINNDVDEGIIPDAIQEITLAISQGASVADALAGFLGGTANAATDKGLAAANIGMLGLLATQIGALSVGIQSIIDAVALQTERLTYLTGSVPLTNSTIGANGIAPWLSQGFGSLTELNNEGTYLLARLGAMGQALGGIQQNTLQIDDKSNNLAIIATRLAQLLGIEAVTDPLVASSLLQLAACICENTGKIAENTEGPEVIPPGARKPEPTVNCSNFSELSRVRVAGISYYGQSGDENGDLYFMVFPGFDQVQGIQTVNFGQSPNVIGYKILNGYEVQLCLSWDLLGYGSELQLYRPSGSSINSVVNILYPLQFNELSTFRVDNTTNFMGTTDTVGVGEQFFVFTVQTPFGEPTPPKDFWLSWIVTPLSS